jgi:hypothetical protein
MMLIKWLPPTLLTKYGSGMNALWINIDKAEEYPAATALAQSYEFSRRFITGAWAVPAGLLAAIAFITNGWWIWSIVALVTAYLGSNSSYNLNRREREFMGRTIQAVAAAMHHPDKTSIAWEIKKAAFDLDVVYGPWIDITNESWKAMEEEVWSEYATKALTWVAEHDQLFLRFKRKIDR